MNSSLEIRLMASLYLAHHYHRREWFQLNEVSKISGVGKSSLQRVLPRLQSRGWIRRWDGESFAADEPAATAVFHFDSSRVPTEIIDEYNSRVQKLERKALHLNQSDNTLAYHKQRETYAEALAFENRHRKGRKAVSMAFKGRSSAWRRAFASAQPRQRIFYQVVKFPFIFDFFFPRRILLPYGSDEPSVPEGMKRAWYNAAKEMLEHRQFPASTKAQDVA